MKRFFDFTFEPFLVITEVGTTLVHLDFFGPRWIVGRVE